MEKIGRSISFQAGLPWLNAADQPSQSTSTPVTICLFKILPPGRNRATLEMFQSEKAKLQKSTSMFQTLHEINDSSGP